jgi:hypothetical protein
VYEFVFLRFALFLVTVRAKLAEDLFLIARIRFSRPASRNRLWWEAALPNGLASVKNSPPKNF